MKRALRRFEAYPPLRPDFPAAEPKRIGEVFDRMDEFPGRKVGPILKRFFQQSDPVREIRKPERATRSSQLMQEEAGQFLVVDPPSGLDFLQFLREPLTEAEKNRDAGGIRRGDYRVELFPVDERIFRSRIIHWICYPCL